MWAHEGVTLDVYLKLNPDSHGLGDQNEDSGLRPEASVLRTQDVKLSTEDSGQRLQEEIPMENE